MNDIRIRDFFGPEGPGDVPPEHFHWGHCHNHHDRCADECDDQLPSISMSGRGLPGDGYVVTIKDPDTCTETYLEGWRKDNVSGELTKEWESENINGGELYYQYNLRPYTNPQTFTITFIYRRPTRCEWSWTTPAIPYIWDANKDGEPDVDGIIGSGVGDLYVRTANKDYPDIIDGKNVKDDAWNERLVFPPGTTAVDYNAPLPEQPWSGNITFGLIGGDVLVPNIYDLAKILGFPAGNIYNIVKGNKGELEDYDDVRDYIWNTGVEDLYIRTAYKDWSLNDPRFAAIWENSKKDDFIKKFGDPVDNKWNERLHFPAGKTHSNFPDLPEALEPWSSTITYGLENGDVLVPNIYDLMILLGINPADYYGEGAEKKSNLADMMKWSAYVQCPVVGQDDYTPTAGLNPHSGQQNDFHVGSDGITYSSRLLITYKPACKIMNVRSNWYGTAKNDVTIRGDTDYYAAGSWMGKGYAPLPTWFRPATEKRVPNYLTFSWWDPSDASGTFRQMYCNIIFTPSGQIGFTPYGGDGIRFTVHEGDHWEIKSTQGIIFYDDWGIENELDAKGHPLSNVPTPGTDPFTIRTLAAEPKKEMYDDCEVYYDFDRSLL